MSRAKEIIDAYESWDPDSESATELAERLGISKARLYQVLEEQGIEPKARRPRKSREPVAHAVGWGLADELGTSYIRIDGDSGLVDELAEKGLRSLMDELEELRGEVAAYRQRYGPLT